MHPDTLHFLSALLAVSAAWRTRAVLTLTAIHPDGGQRTPSRHVPLDKPDVLHDALERLTETNRRGWGAYVGIGLRRHGLTRWQRGGSLDIVALPALYLDIDQPDEVERLTLRGYAPAPSIIVWSGGGYHLYWLLESPTTDFVGAQAVINGLARTLHGDRLTVAQSLRLPGTRNTKSARRGALCHLVSVESQRYRLSDFADVVRAPRPRIPQTHSIRPSPHTTNTLNPTLIAAITERLSRDYAAHPQANSAWMAALCPCGHARDSPGAHFFWNPTIGCGRCHGRHGTLRLTDLCSVLGIDAADYGGIYLHERESA